MFKLNRLEKTIFLLVAVAGPALVLSWLLSSWTVIGVAGLILLFGAIYIWRPQGRDPRNGRFISKLILLAALLLLAQAAGCQAQPQVAQEARAAVSSAATGVAGVKAHTQSAQRHVQNAIPHNDDTGKIHLAAAEDELAEVLDDALEVEDALDTTSVQITALEGQVVAIQGDYSKLEARWFVRWGRWIERILWIVGISWLALGVASILLGLGNPLSLTWRIGKEITRTLPLMNPFSWVRDWILKRRAAADTGGNGG